MREAVYQAIQNETFEDFFYQMRGFRIEERLQKNVKSKSKRENNENLYN